MAERSPPRAETCATSSRISHFSRAGHPSARKRRDRVCRGFSRSRAIQLAVPAFSQPRAHGVTERVARAPHSPHHYGDPVRTTSEPEWRESTPPPRSFTRSCPSICLLYTSDAADDLLCVDLGG